MSMALSFQLLYDGVKLAMSNSSKFKTHRRNLKFTLDCLQPQIIEQIRLQNLQLNIPDQDIVQLQRKIDQGIALVGQLSSINTCNIRVWGSCCSYLMVSYADQLDELNESLRRLLEILRLQSLSQVNHIGILARSTRDRQDELGRRQMEIISNQRQIIDTLMKQQEIIERIEKNSIAASTGKGDAPVQVLRLGEVFQALYDAVDLAKAKKCKFKVVLEDLKFTLDCLKPLIQELVECNKVLHFPKEEILEDFIVYLEKSLELVYKCSMSSLWNGFKTYEYINSLFELDESLQRLFNILRLQIETDVKDAMVYVSKLEKEIEEIEGSFVPLHQSAAPELPLPQAELDVTIVQETRDVNESMDLTGNVEMGDGNHKLIEGSSLALHRVDVEVEEPPSHTVGLDVYVDSNSRAHSGTAWKLTGAPEALSINLSTFEKPLQKFTFADLHKATNGFHDGSLIGSGRFGDVYKAQLKDGSILAIKKLIQISGQGDREFTAEMETIGKIKHRNLVPLLGYCKVREERHLIYEYMKYGSLDDVLHDKKKGIKLNWSARRKIAIGSARGLAFLHHNCIPHIIHRDMKSSNVLVDENLEARVSDFGIVRLMSAMHTPLSVSALAGTPGYVPPEYYQSIRCSTKGDVYSYGVVLLELLTGRRPTDSADFGDNNLVGWMKQHANLKISHVFDPELKREDPALEIELLQHLKVAFACLDDRPWRRPTMIQVMAMFKEIRAGSGMDSQSTIATEDRGFGAVEMIEMSIKEDPKPGKH